MQHVFVKLNFQNVFTSPSVLFLEDIDEMTHDDEMTMTRAR